MSFRPGIKLIPGQVTDRRADTRSELAGVRRSQPKPPKRGRRNPPIVGTKRRAY